jgi:hypothetical protein
VNARKRITASYTETVLNRMTERDIEVAVTVERLRLATAKQLERIHFHSGTPLSNARMCRRRLERLVELGVLARLERRVGGVRAGSSGYVYTLAQAGQRLARHTDGRVRGPWTPGAAYTAHTLAVTELYARLIEAQRLEHVELVTFDPEPDCWRLWWGVGGARLSLKPDANIVVGAGQFEDAWFVEVDRGTEAPSTLGRKLTAYRRYWQSGKEQARTGVFPRVLFLAPSERRKDVLVDVAARQPTEAWPLFQIVLYEDALAVLSGRQR